MNRLILPLLLLLALSSCSTDEPKISTLDFVRIQVTNQNVTVPDGYIYLFYLGDYDVTSVPRKIDDYVFAVRSDGETIYPVSPISDGKYKLGVSLDYSGRTFYWKELSTLYGTPKSGKYLIFIKLTCDKFQSTYKVITINGNKLIKVNIPTSENFSEVVDSQWTITNDR